MLLKIKQIKAMRMPIKGDLNQYFLAKNNKNVSINIL